MLKEKDSARPDGRDIIKPNGKLAQKNASEKSVENSKNKLAEKNSKSESKVHSRSGNS